MADQPLARPWWRRTRIRIGVRMLMALILLIVFLVCAVWRQTPHLTPTEQQLVGKWSLPNPEPSINYILSYGFLSYGSTANVLLIREFGRDRSYRVWAQSLDNPRNSRLRLEGRWCVVNGMLRTEDFPAGPKRAVRDAWRRVGAWTGLPLGTPEIRGNTDVSFRFPDEKSLEITSARGAKFTWKRLP